MITATMMITEENFSLTFYSFICFILTLIYCFIVLADKGEYWKEYLKDSWVDLVGIILLGTWFGGYLLDFIVWKIFRF